MDSQTGTCSDINWPPSLPLIVSLVIDAPLMFLPQCARVGLPQETW